LLTELAGCIIQRILDYRKRITLIGDYSKGKNNSLNDFIYRRNMEISEKIIKKSIRIKAPAEIAWKTWTTHEGLKAFIGVENDIEIKIGGKFEIYFLMDNPLGLRGSEGCKVLSYLPKEMLSFSWNAPPQYKDVRESKYKAWVVVIFKSIEENETEVTLSHLGWPAEKKWEDVFNYFEKAWSHVFNDFERLFLDVK